MCEIILLIFKIFFSLYFWHFRKSKGKGLTGVGHHNSGLADDPNVCELLAYLHRDCCRTLQLWKLLRDIFSNRTLQTNIGKYILEKDLLFGESYGWPKNTNRRQTKMSYCSRYDCTCSIINPDNATDNFRIFYA